jgi:hypothetical protein
MSAPQLRYAGFAEASGVPNIVVDGSPNEATVLAVTHWPGYAQPPGLEADLSAEMAYRYLDHPPLHPPAEVVTNNHFDQDGLVAVHALVGRPGAEASGLPDDRLRQLLVDVAAAGDFDTYRHRDAARAAMALAAWWDADRSPLGSQLAELSWSDRTTLLYVETLPLLVPLTLRPDTYRHLWADDDARLTATEQALAAGTVVVSEHPDLDLAVITVGLPGAADADDADDADAALAPVHPYAVNNASGAFRQLFQRPPWYRYGDRYETWIQYHSRRPPPRVDLRPLAERLSGLEPGSTRWRADGPGSITPTLAPEGPSDLDPGVVEAEVTAHLRAAPPAWDPFRPASERA